jgi:thymidylate synthase ThyX
LPDTNGYLEVIDGVTAITEAGRACLAPYVTNTTDDVYVFTGAMPSSTVAAAMARLSRRPGDMRVTLLDEFLAQGRRDEELLERVISEYGDDSVQQLVSIDFVAEGISNLLTKRLEWARFGAYLEQSTRYIPFDQRDAQGNFSYVIPEELEGDLRAEYVRTMDAIFTTYSLLIETVKDHVLATTSPSDNSRGNVAAWKRAARATALDAVRALLPTATRSTVGVHMSAQSLENLLYVLRADELTESQVIAAKLLHEARKVIPAFLQRVDMPSKGNDLRNIAERLTSGSADDGEAIRLVDYWPSDEGELLARTLFAHSSLSLEEIQRQLAEWPNADREEIWSAAIGVRYDRRDRPGRAFEMPHYEFVVVGDYGTFRDLQRHRVVDALEWQLLTPEHGYAIPKLVTDAGCEGDYRRCFEQAEELYDTVSREVSPSLAQYTTLLGHRMRYHLILNARASYHLLELRTGPAGHPGYRAICQEMFRQIEAVHPHIARGMKHVNLDPPSGLGRLAAEESSERKLAALDARVTQD